MGPGALVMAKDQEVVGNMFADGGSNRRVVSTLQAVAGRPAVHGSNDALLASPEVVAVVAVVRLGAGMRTSELYEEA